MRDPPTATICRGLLVMFLIGMPLSGSAQSNPLAMPAIGDYSLQILSPTLLELTLITTKSPDPSPSARWNFVADNFVLALPSVTNFLVQAGASTVIVNQVGFKRRPLYAPAKQRDLRIANSLYLTLEADLTDGQLVTVKNPAGNLWPDATTTYSAVMEPFRFSPVVHVNQVGYLPIQSKKGMIGYYLGSLGEMAIVTMAFNIIRVTTHEVVYTGQLIKRKDVGFNYLPTPYQQVYEADFTSFQTPGEYALQVPGIGISFPFLIDEGTAAAFTRAYALGLYQQRCGTANVMPFTRFEHGICHSALAEIPTMAFAFVNGQLSTMTADYDYNPLHTAPQLKDVDASLYPFVRTGLVNVSGGHHDAGDYSKYTINSAALIHHLVFAVDSFAGAGALDNLNIPESGDGKSDLLQEAKWEADFLSRMQDADGGFYFLVYPRDRSYENDVLPDHGDSQVVFPKTTAATAAAVGALAEIGSSPLFKRQFPLEAAAYLGRAHKGWSFLTRAIVRYGKNGAYQKITHYGDDFMHDDELAWAAAAMFAATSDVSFQKQLKAWYDPSDPNTLRWGWWRLFEGYGCAARCYAFAARSGRVSSQLMDSAYLAKCEAEIIASGDDIARFAEQTAYGTSFPDVTKAFGTAGWYFSMERAFELATANQLVPKPAYEEAIIGNLNYEGGCNPLNMTYITGLGWKRWREIVHQYAQNDKNVLPPSGLPLGNIQSGFGYLDPYKEELGKLCYPADEAETAPYALYDRWGDSYNTSTEFVIVDQARSLATAAFLMGKAPKAASFATRLLTGQIAGLPLLVPADQIITATFLAPGVDTSKARIVWEATDQEPSFGSMLTFAARSPGEQQVEVEAQLPDGTRILARTNFIASFSMNLQPNLFQSSPLKTSPEIVVLYHLDGGLNDEIAKNPSLVLGGAAYLDTINLGWMANRGGQALRFFDLGDNASVTIPANSLFAGDSTSEITLEALVYVNGYKGYNKPPSRLLSMQLAWDASLEWIEDTYSGLHFEGGAEFDLFGQVLADSLPLKKWFHLSMRLSRTSYSVYIDGSLIGSTPANELPNWAEGVVNVELGNFDAWMDEVVVRSKQVSAQRLPDGGLRINFIGMPETRYQIQASTDLSSWISVGQRFSDSHGRYFFDDPDPQKHPTRFFRALHR